MYGNIVTTQFKSEEGLETAVEQLRKLSEEFDDAPGFQAIYMIRTGPTTTKHTVIFDTEENFTTTRDRMFPIFKEAVGPHITSPPTQEPGPVVIDR